MSLDFSFKVLEFKQLQGGWKVLEIDQTVPLVESSLCPSDKNPLRTLCTFVGREGKQKIRFGCCRSCGYLGYIDRPTKDWIDQFYLETWKSNESELINESEIQKIRSQFLTLNSSGKNSIHNPNHWLKNIQIDEKRYICEIGAGYGDDLKILEQLGFTKLIGVENSKRRAEIAKQAHNLRVLTNPFEDKNVQLELKKLAPFTLIFSRHVLEHVYSPAEIIQCASGLQKIDDYLIITVPNVKAESAMTCLFFLPHLHSFSKESLIRLFGNHGYTVVDDSLTTDQEICLVAQKMSEPTGRYSEIIDYFNEILEKFIKGLALTRNYFRPIRHLWWEKNFGKSRQSLHFKSTLLNNFYFKIILKINRLLSNNFSHKIHSCLISSVKDRYISQDESPIEIQFEGNVKLLYK